MNLLTLTSVGVAVVTTGILPALVDPARRFIGVEPSSSLVRSLVLLTPRWFATGILLVQCMRHGEWGAAHHDFLRYALVLLLHTLVGLISFFSIAMSPSDLKSIPTSLSRCFVSVGFLAPLSLVVFASWFLESQAGLESNHLGVGPLAGCVLLITIAFGAGILVWALVADLREQSRLSHSASASEVAAAAAAAAAARKVPSSH